MDIAFRVFLWEMGKLISYKVPKFQSVKVPKSQSAKEILKELYVSAREINQH